MPSMRKAPDGHKYGGSQNQSTPICKTPRQQAIVTKKGTESSRRQSQALRPMELSGAVVVFNSNHLLLGSASLQHRDQQPDSLRLLHRQRPSLIDQVAINVLVR